MGDMFDAQIGDTASVPLQQHPFFTAALQACGQQTMVLDGPEPVQLMQRTLRGGMIRMAMLSRAVLPAPERLLDRLRVAGLHHQLIILSPNHPVPDLARIGAVPVMTHAFVAEIDLCLPQEARRANLHQKWRNRLVHSEKQGLHITRTNMPLNPHHWLLRHETAQRIAQGYRNWPAALTLAYAQANPGMAQLFTAFEGRTPVAAMLFLRHGTGASYHMGHITARGRTLSAHNLLLWRATNWLAGKGHQRLDLGLIDTTHAPGLARFKLGAGATARRLGGTWVWWPPLGRVLRPLGWLDRVSMR